MQLILLQPDYLPDPCGDLKLITALPALIAPDWNNLMIQAFIKNRSRHLCNIIDFRTESNAIETTQALLEDHEVIFAVDIIIEHLRSSAGILEWAEKNFPDVPRVVYGDWVTQHRLAVSYIPHIDRLICGCPKNGLKSLLDFYDNPKRLERCHGIGTPEAPPENDVDDVHIQGLLKMPSWEDVNWANYQKRNDHAYNEAEIRISSGNSHTPPDKAFGDAQHPITFYPMDEIAKMLQVCQGSGVTHIFVNDPPGVWNSDRLSQWCTTLRNHGSSTPWGMQFLPAYFDEEDAEELFKSSCRRVEFIWPSCDPDVLKSYGCIITPKDFLQTIHHLHHHKIQVLLSIWVGGPEEKDKKHEADRIVKLIESLNYCPYKLVAFPFSFDSKLYKEHIKNSGIDLTKWVLSNLDSNQEVSIPLWGGKEALSHLESVEKSINKRIRKNMKRRFKRAFTLIREKNWIETFERLAIGKPPQA